jgi:hypothetical protein
VFCVTPASQTRPLGVRADLPLGEAQLASLRVLESYDLTRVRDRLLQDGALPQSWVDEALLEFRRYLGLQVVAPGPRTMYSHQIDIVWHASLLFTRLYADLCERAFGHFFHHEPSADSGATRPETFADFEQLYTEVYGPPGRLWYLEGEGD